MIDDALWTITTVILAIVLLVIFPIYQEYQEQEMLIELKLIQDVDKAVQKISAEGKIDRMAYEQLCTKLASSGYHFDIVIERQARKVYPVYEDPLNSNSFNGKLELIYETIDNAEIMSTLYAENNTVYKFAVGDYVSISAKSTSKSRTDALAELLWQTNIKRPSFYTKIGTVVAHETK